MTGKVNMLRGNEFIAGSVDDTPRVCSVCLYNNDGGKYTGSCPYFSGLFSAPRNGENMRELDGKAPGNYCNEWLFGLVGED